MTDEDWKKFIKKEMEKSIDDVMAEIEADPKMKDVKPPEGMYEELMAMIHEDERQKIYEQLSDEDKELIQLGRAYKKRRSFDKFVVALAAVIVGLGLGSVCIGKDENFFRMIFSMIAGQDRAVVNSGDTEIVTYVAEEEVYEDIENEYGIIPVKLDYLPQGIKFKEAVVGSDIQSIYLYYGAKNKTQITYIIRPNYRESSVATVIEDDKLQEYTMLVGGNEVLLTEYNIEESNENRWLILWMYKDVQYTLNITNMEQAEVEKVIKTLGFLSD